MGNEFDLLDIRGVECIMCFLLIHSTVEGGKVAIPGWGIAEFVKYADSIYKELSSKLVLAVFFSTLCPYYRIYR